MSYVVGGYPYYGWSYNYPYYNNAQTAYGYPYYGYGSNGYPYYAYGNDWYGYRNNGYSCPTCGTNNLTRSFNNRTLNNNWW